MPSLTLAQVFEPPLPDVPPAPFLETWLLSDSLRTGLVLATLALIAWFTLGRPSTARWRLPAVALLAALAIAAFLIGRFVETPREELRRRVRDLVDAAIRADTPALAPMLHPDARVRTRFGSAQSRDRILELTRRAAAVVQFHRVKAVAVDLRGAQVARTHLSLSVSADSAPPLSHWIIDWQKPTPESPWVATSIEPIWIQGMSDPAGPPP